MENFKLLSNRLTWAVERKLSSGGAGVKITKRLLAQHAGVSPSAAGYWFADTNGIEAEAARKLAKFLEVDPVWLESGEGRPEPRNTDAGIPGARQVVLADKDDPAFVQIPMVKLRLQAGVTGFQTEPDRRDGGTLGMRRNWLERSGFDPTQLIAIQVRGESMEPSLYEDDIVVLNTADKKLVDGQVYAFNYEGEAIVKRLSRDAGEWWLMSDNLDQRKYHRKICRGEACIVIGRVVRKESDRI
jgi:phage repressor protein C with HTH and peptisase S24 domain